MSVPREMSQLSVEAFTAGIIEAALDGMGFVSHAWIEDAAIDRDPNAHRCFCRIFSTTAARPRTACPRYST